MKQLTDGGLYLPTSVIDDLVEARVAEAQRLEQPLPVFGRTGFAGPFESGQNQRTLLREGAKGWAAIGASRIADRMQSIELVAKREMRLAGGEVETETAQDSTLQMVLDMPGPVFDMAQLMRLAGWWLVTLGEAYWQKIEDGAGVVRELWPLPPQNVAIIAGGDEVIAGYQVTTSAGGQVNLRRDELVRFWLPNPETLYEAQGSLEPQRLEWETERFRTQTLRSHYEHDGTPRVVMESQPQAHAPNDRERESFYAVWRSNYNRRFGRSQGVPAFVPPGFTTKQLSALALGDTIDLGENLAEQIMAAYGVPGSIAGMVLDVNRAAAETNRFTFDTYTIEPYANLITQTLSRDVAPTHGDDLFVDYTPFVEPDKEFLLAREKQDLETKVRSVQQVLRDRNANPEDAPWGELPVGSLNDQPYDGSSIFDQGGGAEGDGRLRGAPAPPTGDPASPPPTVSRASYFAPDAIWARQQRQESAWLARYQRTIAALWEQQRIATRDRAETLLGRQVVVGDIFNPREWLRVFVEALLPLDTQIMSQSGREAAQGLGTNFDFNSVVANELRTEAAQKITQINATTTREIQRILAAGQEAGKSGEAIARDLDGVFRNRARSRMVARTEVLRARQLGQTAAFEQSGVVALRQWNTALDGDVRDSHAINGQRVTLSELFTLANGQQARYPGDPRLPAEDSINCRCFQSPVVVE